MMNVTNENCGTKEQMGGRIRRNCPRRSSPRNNKKKRKDKTKLLLAAATTAAAAVTVTCCLSASMNTLVSSSSNRDIVAVDAFSFNPFQQRSSRQQYRTKNTVSISSSSTSNEENHGNINSNSVNPSLVDWKLESNGKQITGRSVNHPLIPDGELLTTAYLDLDLNCLDSDSDNEDISNLQAGDVITTIKGTKYELLKSSPESDSDFDTSSSTNQQGRVFKEDVFSYSTGLPYEDQLAFLDELTDMVKTLQAAEVGTASTPMSSSTNSDPQSQTNMSMPPESPVSPDYYEQQGSSSRYKMYTSPAIDTVASSPDNNRNNNNNNNNRGSDRGYDMSPDNNMMNGNNDDSNNNKFSTSAGSGTTQQQGMEESQRPTFPVDQLMQQQQQESLSINNNNGILGGAGGVTLAAAAAVAAVSLGGGTLLSGIGTDVMDEAKRQAEASLSPQAKELLASVTTEVQKQSKVVLPYLEEQIRIAEMKLEESRIEEKAKNAWNEVAESLNTPSSSRTEATTTTTTMAAATTTTANEEAAAVSPESIESISTREETTTDTIKNDAGEQPPLSESTKVAMVEESSSSTPLSSSSSLVANTADEEATAIIPESVEAISTTEETIPATTIAEQSMVSSSVDDAVVDDVAMAMKDEGEMASSATTIFEEEASTSLDVKADMIIEEQAPTAVIADSDVTNKVTTNTNTEEGSAIENNAATEMVTEKAPTTIVESEEVEYESLQAQAAAEEQESDAARIVSEQLEAARLEVEKADNNDNKNNNNIEATTTIATVEENKNSFKKSSPSLIENFGGNFVVVEESQPGDVREPVRLSVDNTFLNKDYTSDNSIIDNSVGSDTPSNKRSVSGQNPTPEMVKDAITVEVERVVDSSSNKEGANSIETTTTKMPESIVVAGGVFENGRHVIDTVSKNLPAMIDTGKKTAQSIADTGREVVDTGKRTFHTIQTKVPEMIETGKRTAKAIEDTSQKAGVKGKEVYETGRKYAGIVNEKIPILVENGRKVVDAVNEKVPGIVETGQDILQDEQKVKTIAAGVTIGATVVTASVAAYQAEQQEKKTDEIDKGNNDGPVREPLDGEINGLTSTNDATGISDTSKGFPSLRTNDGNNTQPSADQRRAATENGKLPVEPRTNMPQVPSAPKQSSRLDPPDSVISAKSTKEVPSLTNHDKSISKPIVVSSRPDKEKSILASKLNTTAPATQEMTKTKMTKTKTTTSVAPVKKVSPPSFGVLGVRNNKSATPTSPKPMPKEATNGDRVIPLQDENKPSTAPKPFPSQIGSNGKVTSQPINNSTVSKEDVDVSKIKVPKMDNKISAPQIVPEKQNFPSTNAKNNPSKPIFNSTQAKSASEGVIDVTPSFGMPDLKNSTISNATKAKSFASSFGVTPFTASQDQGKKLFPSIRQKMNGNNNSENTKSPSFPVQDRNNSPFPATGKSNPTMPLAQDEKKFPLPAANTASKKTDSTPSFGIRNAKTNTSSNSTNTKASTPSSTPFGVTSSSVSQGQDRGKKLFPSFPQKINDSNNIEDILSAVQDRKKSPFPATRTSNPIEKKKSPFPSTNSFPVKDRNKSPFPATGTSNSTVPLAQDEKKSPFPSTNSFPVKDRNKSPFPATGTSNSTVPLAQDEKKSPFPPTNLFPVKDRNKSPFPATGTSNPTVPLTQDEKKKSPFPPTNSFPVQDRNKSPFPATGTSNPTVPLTQDEKKKSPFPSHMSSGPAPNFGVSPKNTETSTNPFPVQDRKKSPFPATGTSNPTVPLAQDIKKKNSFPPQGARPNFGVSPKKTEISTKNYFPGASNSKPNFGIPSTQKANFVVSKNTENKTANKKDHRSYFTDTSSSGYDMSPTSSSSYNTGPLLAESVVETAVSSSSSFPSYNTGPLPAESDYMSQPSTEENLEKRNSPRIRPIEESALNGNEGMYGKSPDELMAEVMRIAREQEREAR
jgi:hypothetical protein